MPLAKRLIPRLDIKGPNLVKGVCLEGLRVLGKPEDFAKLYYEQGADELIYQDIVASLYGRNSLYDIINRTSKEIFIPLTVGGGIRTVEDISKVLRAGADKVAINTAALLNPGLIDEASRKFGSSTIVAAIETIRQADGRYLAFTDNGRNKTQVDAVSWAVEAQRRGAGEILLTSVDKEGTGLGFDIDFISRVADKVKIPVVAHGGAGSSEHVLQVFKQTQASGAAISSILHYNFSKLGPANLKTAQLGEIKKYLVSEGIACRL